MKVIPDLRPLNFVQFNSPETQARGSAFFDEMRRRRTVRDFSDRAIPSGVLENAIKAAGTAPSGANLQPWHFAVVQDPAIKTRIRMAAEAEEREFYHSRAPQEWLDALARLGTDDQKPFLEIAPALVVIFAKAYDMLADGRTVKNYYANESVGIATGFLISGLHLAGLATLTHTPSPMSFLNDILERPKNERPFLLLVVGYPANHARVPHITKKPLEEICSFH